MNKVLDQGNQFNLCPATSSPLWARRHKAKSQPSPDLKVEKEKSDKSDRSDKSDKSERSDRSDKSERSDKSRRGHRKTRSDSKVSEEVERKKSITERGAGAGIRRSASDDRSDMMTSIDAFSLSRSSSSASEDGFSFPTD